ncbi:hypothetical protein ACFQLX_10255 [Streptomyces polyrhachis]|uniref:Uncharacterized protein n=1 Tax=Streptomyces polyrhachis TaxID=1282885 RepID=A0ABW2GCJ5_9ACTN
MSARRLIATLLRRPLPRLRAAHLSVLDGRTLNICLRLPDDTATAHLDGFGELTLGAGTFSAAHIDGTVPLRVEVTPVRGRPRRYAVDVPAPRGDGPTLPGPGAPVGLCREGGREQGAAALRRTPPAPGAEVEDVEVGWTRVTVRGRLLGASPAGAVAELALRSGEFTVELPTRWDGDRFTAHLGPGPLAQAVREQTYDLRLRLPGGGRPLRMGRLRTDVAAPKKVFRLPDRLLLDPSGLRVRVAPYYTPTGRLALTAERLT